MPVVNIRELARETSRVVSQVAATGRPALITRGGKPVAALMPVDAQDLEDWVLANHPNFLKSYAEAERDFAEGRSISLDRYLARPGTSEPRSKRRRTGRTKRGTTRRG